MGIGEKNDRTRWINAIVTFKDAVRQSIEAGLADSEAGRTKSVEDVRKMFGLNP